VLFPNQFVNVRLLVDTMTGATLAPNAGIQLGASGNFVYLLNDDSTVSKRDIVTGPGDGKHTVIASGLKAGDKVVIDGVDRLRDGATVKVVDGPASPAGQAAAGGGLEQSGGAPAAGSAEHHRRRHDQAGSGDGSASPDAASPASRATQAGQPSKDGPAGGASTESAAPAAATTQGSGATTRGATQ
jgi:membrane fusion protein, multidrug efflux system